MASMDPPSEEPISIPENEKQTSAIDSDLGSSENNKTPSEFTTRATLTLMGTFSILFVSVGFVNAFGVFQEYYEESLLSSSSPSTISWLGSFNVFCIFGGSLGTGILNDKFGPRVIIFVGSVTTLLAVFMTSLCKEFYQFFLAQGLLLGLGLSALFCPAIATVQLYFRRQRALTLGITVSGSSLGGVIWPIAIRRLIVDVGFGWAIRISAFIMLPLLIFSFLTIRPPPLLTPKPPHTLSFTCARHPVVILTALGFFFIYFGLFTPFFYITPYALTISISPNLSFYLISILNATSLFGRILPGLLADKYGTFNIAIFAALTSGIICCCMNSCKSLGGIVVFALAYGFSSGAIISLSGACATKVVEPKDYGTAIGVVMAVLSVAGLVGTPIVGQFLSHEGWLAVVLWSGFMMIFGAGFLVAARLKLSKKIWDKV